MLSASGMKKNRSATAAGLGAAGKSPSSPSVASLPTRQRTAVEPTFLLSPSEMARTEEWKKNSNMSLLFPPTPSHTEHPLAVAVAHGEPRRLSMAQSSGEIGLSGKKKWMDEIEIQLAKKRIDLANLQRTHADLTAKYQKKKAEEWDPAKADFITYDEEFHRLVGEKKRYEVQSEYWRKHHLDIANEFVPQIEECKVQLQRRKLLHDQNLSVESDLNKELEFKMMEMNQVETEIARGEQRLTKLEPPPPATTPRPVNWAQDSKKECAENLLMLFKSMSRDSKFNVSTIPDSFTVDHMNSQSILDITSFDMMKDGWRTIWYEFATNPACPPELKDSRFHCPPRLVGVGKIGGKLGLGMKFVHAFDLPVHPNHAD